MAFTNTQLLAIKADILADPVLNAFPNAGDGNIEIALRYNALASPDFWVWNSQTSVSSIFDSITWANFTPVDAPDGTTIWTNRALACQGKQFNIQTLLVGRNELNGANTTMRAGLQDALTAIPSGVGGANKSGGWTAVQLILQRQAKRIEKLFATGTGSQASPAVCGYEGTISGGDVYNARIL